MCKKIIDILFPLNVLGKKVVCKQYRLPDGTDITIPVSWSGDRLELAYTAITKDRNTRKVTNTPVKVVQLNGTAFSEDFVRGSHGHFVHFIGADNNESKAWNMIYFKCTNVTSLVVNGETLI